MPPLCVDSLNGYVFNKVMKFLAPFCAAIITPLLFSCAVQTSHIEHVTEIPLKTTSIPAEDVGMHRSQSTFLLHGAVSHEQRLQRLGQYYFVTWYDAMPDKPAKLILLYRQGTTGSKILSKSISYPAGRDGGIQRPVFEFTGDEAHKYNKDGASIKGQILAWKLMLVDEHGKTISERHSYLWDDKV